jgi:hypothetical protein
MRVACGAAVAITGIIGTLVTLAMANPPVALLAGFALLVLIVSVGAGLCAWRRAPRRKRKGAGR